MRVDSAPAASASHQATEGYLTQCNAHLLPRPIVLGQFSPMIRATPESPRMFDRDLFDVFSRTHPIVVPILYVPGAVMPLAHGLLRHRLGTVGALSLSLLGFVTWSLAEYWLHRLVLNFTARGPVG
jgi:hypothetical protein